VDISQKLADDDQAVTKYQLDEADLAGVRPWPKRIDLPPEERAAWDALWADVRSALGFDQPETPTIPGK
jgi:hypothetical protein